MPLSRYDSVLCQLTSQPRDELRGRTNLLIDGRAIIPTVPSAHWTRQNTGHVSPPALETLLRVFTGKKYLHSVEGLGNVLRLRHLKRGAEFTVEAGPGVVTQPLPSYGGTHTAESLASLGVVTLFGPAVGGAMLNLPMRTSTSAEWSTCISHLTTLAHDRTLRALEMWNRRSGNRAAPQRSLWSRPQYLGRTDVKVFQIS